MNKNLGFALAGNNYLETIFLKKNILDLNNNDFILYRLILFEYKLN